METIFVMSVAVISSALTTMIMIRKKEVGAWRNFFFADKGWMALSESDKESAQASYAKSARRTSSQRKQKNKISIKDIVIADAVSKPKRKRRTKAEMQTAKAAF